PGDVRGPLAPPFAHRPWIPRLLRAPLAAALRPAERLAERRADGLLLAEPAYQDRFRRVHPVVRNTVCFPRVVSEPGDSVVVYIGALSRARGAVELVDVG